MTKIQVAGLNCQIVDALNGNEPELLAFLCHGFGAPGDDLVPLAQQYLLRHPSLQNKVRFVFPEAPLSLEAVGMPGSRAWWMIDMEALNRAMMTGEFRDLEDSCPEGMEEAREQFINVIDTLLKEYHLSYKNLVLGGFSQGAMLSVDSLLHLPETPAGMCLFSGTLLNKNKWKGLLAKHKGLKVVQSHGRQDPILPFHLADTLKTIMEDSELNVTFIPFEGAHQIPENALRAYVEMLENL